MPAAKYKILFKFSKAGLIRFISHLDLMRLFARAARGSGLPVYFSEGFNPHPKISIKQALKVGVESHEEEAFIYLNSKIGPLEFITKFSKCLPQGVKILEARYE